ncbi:hypothetical protein H7J88_02345 [Mycolicibacterium flavescens]|uniref:Uncharacterized protein n=1 Tax=Mycolicibacterium flavescens TaxID=1776 RepID=A0A1E3REA2_MYCFV|nr:hypothetical protein [Mycolicibacterium flavescens]MCV7278485.1 hypothetical protein [Mycolicibacterium flavescens]ODQ87737.1 hypothetical protein BHQ18_21990 [Mycolicibacterium flavescens]
MSCDHPRIEALGDHEFLIRFTLDADTVAIQVRADPEIVARIAGPDPDEARVVAATAAFLIARQRPDDLPPQLDLDDVAAAYDGYVAELHDQIGSAPADD